MKKIHLRLIFLIAGRLALVLVALLILYRYELSRLSIIKKDVEEQKKYLVDKIVDLKSKPLSNLAFDYTYWDDMVKFVNDPFTEKSKNWASQSIETALPTYEANLACVYSKNFELVYTIDNLKKDTLIPLDLKIIKKAFFKSKSANFFISTSHGLLEVRGYSIHPSFDFSRVTPPKGYFIVARLWSQSYVDELSKLTQTKIKLTPIVDNIIDNDDYNKDHIVHFSKLLYDCDNKPIMKIDVNTESGTIRDLVVLSQRTLFVSIIFLFFIMLLVSFFSFYSIRKPISSLIKSFQHEDASLITKLAKKEKSEFGILANLVISFLDQKNALLNKQAEIYETKVRLYALIDNLPFLAWLKDKDCKFTAVNEPYAKLCGFTIKEIIGKTDYDLWPKNYAQTNVDSDKEVMQTKQQRFFDEKITVLKGEPWYEVYKKPIINRNGEVIGVTGFARDITHRKITERATKIQRDLIKTMIDALDDSIIITTLDGIVMECNNTTLNVFNVSSKESFIGSSIFDLFHDKIKDQVQIIVQEVIDNDVIKELDYKYYSKDGHRHTLKSNISLVKNANGVPTFLVAKTKSSKINKPRKKTEKSSPNEV